MFFALFLGSAAPAQDVEAAWRDLIVQGLQAAGANQYPNAEAFLIKAVHESERFGTNDVRVGTTLNSLGLVYKAQNKWADAEGAFKRALTILEKGLGEETVDVANVNFNIASVMMEQQKYEASMTYLQTVRRGYERHFGGSSDKVASVLCMIGDVQRFQKNYKEAEVNLKRCSQSHELNGGIVNPELGNALHSLALVYQQLGKYAQADSSFKLAEKIREKTQGIMSPLLADTLEAHALMLKQMGRDDEAVKDARLAGVIRRHYAK